MSLRNPALGLVLATMTMLALAATAAAQPAPPPPPAPTAVDQVAQTQSRLLAKRAAQADAYRNLAEQVKGLHITATTFVKDFVAESDDIATAVNTFLRGAKMGEVRYLEDNSAEVTMELALNSVEAELTRVYKADYKGDKYKIDDFQALHVTNKTDKITVTGNGAPRAVSVEAYDQDGKPVVQPAGAGLGLPPEWKNIPAQARLMAKRAAQVDAYRNLAEQVKGLRISSNTYVRDFVAESDQINTALNTWLKGAKIGEVRYLRDLSVEMDLKLPVESVVTELTREYEAYYKGNKVKARDFESIKTEVKIDWVIATGTGLPPPKYLDNRPTIGLAPIAAPAGIPDWAKNTVKATGNGVKPAAADSDAQARLMALRAAKLDALRNLSEQVNGVKINSTTTVRDFVTAHDKVRTEIDDFLQGVKVANEDYKADTGEATVVVELPLEPLWVIVSKYKEVTVEKTIVTPAQP